jgi:hypothetical protein
MFENKCVVNVERDAIRSGKARTAEPEQIRHTVGVIPRSIFSARLTIDAHFYASGAMSSAD